MTDVRDSTLNALKLSCPSAEVLPSPDTPKSMPGAFIHGDAEWSDEEELIPKNRRKTRYIPSIKVAEVETVAEPIPVKDKEWRQSSSGSSSGASHRDSGFSGNGSPLLPPKSPSRPEVRPGSSQDDLVQRFYQVTRERDALRKELQRRSVSAYGVPARDSVVFKSEEKALIEELQALRHEIQEWSQIYFSGPLSSRSKQPHLHSGKDLFGNLTDNHAAYLKHQHDRPLLIQAYVWSKLQDRIFSNLHKGCGYVWAGKLGDRKLRPVNDTLRKAVKNEEQAEEYHRWRAMTVNMMVPQIDGKWRPVFDAAPVLKHISKFCGRLRRRLRPWSTISLRQGKEQLYNIVSAAVALDLKMKRQRADYRFVTFTGGRTNQLYGYGFYDSEMEDIDDQDTKARKVELSVAPALERCGNANGHIFENSFILIKADVSCKRLDKKRRQPQGRHSGMKPGLRSFWSSNA